MKVLFISMLIGFFAGIVDIVPMIIQKLDKRAIVSAFLQYFFVSIIIVNINLPGIIWWAQGGIISLALALPIIISMSVILGTLIGIAGHFIK